MLPCQSATQHPVTRNVVQSIGAIEYRHTESCLYRILPILTLKTIHDIQCIPS